MPFAPLFYLGRMVRETGTLLHKMGCQLQGNWCHHEQLSRHRRIMNFALKKPMLGPGSFVAPNASVIGQVRLGAESAVWYGAVLRGDVNEIKIGSKTSIGDRVIIHESGGIPKGPLPTVVGNSVVIEAGVVLHACTIGDGSKIGMGSIVLDGAIVESNSMLNPGSLLAMGKKIPSGEVWGGNPAAFIRKITEEDKNEILSLAENNTRLARAHETEHSKSAKEVYQDTQEDIMLSRINST